MYSYGRGDPFRASTGNLYSGEGGGGGGGYGGRRRPSAFDDEIPSWTPPRGRRPSNVVEKDRFSTRLDVPARRRRLSIAEFDRLSVDEPEYEPPVGVPILLPRRGRSPSGSRYSEEEFSPRYEDEFRERRFSERRHSRRRSSATRFSVRGSSTSISELDRGRDRGGRTKIPRKMLSIRAVHELGYPYEEEGDRVIIMRALSQEQINQLLDLTEDIRSGNHRLSYKSEQVKVIKTIEGPHHHHGTTTTTEIIKDIPIPPPVPQAPVVIETSQEPTTTIIKVEDEQPHHHHKHEGLKPPRLVRRSSSVGDSTEVKIRRKKNGKLEFVR